jgi:hypothetical protein
LRHCHVITVTFPAPRTLDVLLLLTRLFLVVWSLRRFIIALADLPLTHHVIMHLLPPPSHLGQILVVCK